VELNFSVAINYLAGAASTAAAGAAAESVATVVESAGASSTAGASTAVESTASVVSAAFSLQETNIAATIAKLKITFFILLNYKG
jgi:hypothetical protein